MSKKFVLPRTEDPCPDLLVDYGPKNEGVGRWVPEQKHLLLANYIGAARQAMKAWPHRVFIDPFCGPGRIQVAGEGFTRDGGAVVATRQASSWGAPYTRVLLGDIDPERGNPCAARVSALGSNAEIFVGPAVQTVQSMVRKVPSGSLCLAYIDPYNLEYLSFSILEALAKLPKVDIAVHFSLMDLLRNVEFELDPSRARFDDVAPGWRDALKGTSKSALPVAFFNYWSELVKSLGFTFSKEMPLVHNNTNHPIYRLVFFARHDLPNKLWDDVAKSKNYSLDF
ncbi:MAG: three-Cys-motif partner protein TcmP [Pseudomonadota bacterium]